MHLVRQISIVSSLLLAVLSPAAATAQGTAPALEPAIKELALSIAERLRNAGFGPDRPAEVYVRAPFDDTYRVVCPALSRRLSQAMRTALPDAFLLKQLGRTRTVLSQGFGPGQTVLNLSWRDAGDETMEVSFQLGDLSTERVGDLGGGRVPIRLDALGPSERACLAKLEVVNSIEHAEDTLYVHRSADVFSDEIGVVQPGEPFRLLGRMPYASGDWAVVRLLGADDDPFAETVGFAAVPRSARDDAIGRSIGAAATGTLPEWAMDVVGDWGGWRICRDAGADVVFQQVRLDAGQGAGAARLTSTQVSYRSRRDEAAAEVRPLDAGRFLFDQIPPERTDYALTLTTGGEDGAVLSGEDVAGRGCRVRLTRQPLPEDIAVASASTLAATPGCTAENTLRLSPSEPSVEFGGPLAPPPGREGQRYTLTCLDLTALPATDHRLVTVFSLGRGAEAASFDLFPGDAPIPTGARPAGSLGGRSDISPGRVVSHEYRVRGGEIVKFGAGATWFGAASWSSGPAGAGSRYHVTATLR